MKLKEILIPDYSDKNYLIRVQGRYNFDAFLFPFADFSMLI